MTIRPKPSETSGDHKETLPVELADALVELRVVRGASEIVATRRLTGGVSSDIWRVDTLQRVVCVGQRTLMMVEAVQDLGPQQQAFEAVGSCKLKGIELVVLC